MSKDHHFDISQCSEAVRKLNERIQEKANSGWEMPSGWLFKGLTIHFHQNDDAHDAESDETTQTHQQTRLRFANNTARFAGASIADSPKSSAVTHIVVAPNPPSSEISSIRKSLSTNPGKKLPHLVTVEWIEACWKQRTLLDEEGTLQGLSPWPWYAMFLTMISFLIQFSYRVPACLNGRLTSSTAQEIHITPYIFHRVSPLGTKSRTVGTHKKNLKTGTPVLTLHSTNLSICTYI
jgi:hypothetical protein